MRLYLLMTSWLKFSSAEEAKYTNSFKNFQVLTWQNARNTCKDKGLTADLVTIESQIKEEDTTLYAWGGPMWLGLTRSTNPEQFVWVNGERLGSPSFWGTDEPNKDQSMNCVEMRNDGRWYVTSCDDERTSLCEMDSFPVSTDVGADVCDGSESVDDIATECSGHGLRLSISHCIFSNIGMNPLQSALAVYTGEECKIEDIDNNRVFEIPASSDCGTEVNNNGTHLVYSNKVLGSAGKTNGPISRNRVIDIGFSCAFELDVTVSLDSGITPLTTSIEIVLDSQESSFDVEMALFTDETFSTKVEGEFEVNVPDMLYLNINLVDGSDELVVRGKKCWATPEENADNAVQYVFIDNFCAMEQDENYLNVLSNGEAHDISFALQSFTFLDENAGEFFLHCEVNLCDTSVANCRVDCAANSRRRRSENQVHSLTAMKIGPIQIKNNL